MFDNNKRLSKSSVFLCFKNISKDSRLKTSQLCTILNCLCKEVKPNKTVCVLLLYKTTRISGRYAPFILGLPAGFPRAHAGAHYVRFSCRARKHSLHLILIPNSHFPKTPIFKNPNFPIFTFPKFTLSGN